MRYASGEEHVRELLSQFMEYTLLNLNYSRSTYPMMVIVSHEDSGFAVNSDFARIFDEIADLTYPSCVCKIILVWGERSGNSASVFTMEATLPIHVVCRKAVYKLMNGELTLHRDDYIDPGPYINVLKSVNWGNSLEDVEAVANC